LKTHKFVSNNSSLGTSGVYKDADHRIREGFTRNLVADTNPSDHAAKEER